MRKRIISIITALSMCATMAFMPITASAASPGETLRDAILGAFEDLEILDGSDDGKATIDGRTIFERQGNLINVYRDNQQISGESFTEVLVDTNIQAKTNTSSYSDLLDDNTQKVNNINDWAYFTLKTTMYMEDVYKIYTDYITLAEQLINTTAPSQSGELNLTNVRGQFTVNIKLPAGLTIADETMKQSHEDMYGLSFENNGNIRKLYRETARTYTPANGSTGEELNITIVPCQDNVTTSPYYADKETLYNYLNNNIVIECPVKAKADAAPYTVKGYVNGHTDICTQTGLVLAKVNYKANQKADIVNEPAPGTTTETATVENALGGNKNIVLTEDVKVIYEQPSFPGGGGSTNYTLTFETNGGNAIASITRNKGTVINLTPFTPTKDGYKFEGWYLDKELTKPADKVTLNSNMTVYAKWSEVDINKVTLTFVTNGGSKVDSVTTDKGTVVNINDYITLREGYTFEGWYLDEALTIPVDTLTLNADTTVYAKWAQTSRPSQLTDEHYAYIIGRDDGFVHPSANITRAEVATIFFRLLTAEVRDGNLTKANQFNDVNEDDWFCAAVSTLEDLGIIYGRTDTTFVPNAFITRAEYAAIASRFSDVVYNGKSKFSDIANHWAEDEINEASHVGWIIGDGGKFRPDDYITRAEAMTLTNRVLKRIPETTDDLLDNMVKWPDNMDTAMWYYLAVQEATNSHDYRIKADNVHEKWTKIEAPRDWTEYEK